MHAHPTATRRQPPAPTTGASPLLRAVAAPCGWFDSSFELQRGVEVQELSDAQLLALWQALRPAPLGACAATLH